MSARRSSALAAAVCAALLAALPGAASAEEQAPPDVPAGPARIVGRVLRGEASAPVPGVEVVLYALTADGIPGLRHTRSDAQGAFSFDEISNAPSVAYLVGARYQGIPVPGGRVAFAAGQASATADIRVADLTTNASGVHIRSQTLRLFREAEGLRVEETFAIDNTGAQIVYASPAERAKATPGVRASLPAGSADFRMPLGVIPEGLARDGSALRYYGPFYPGAQDLDYAYRIAPTEGGAERVRFAFSVTPAAGVERLEVLVPDGVGALEAQGLASAGRGEDAGRTVARYTAAAPRAAVALALDAPRARLDPGAISIAEATLVLQADDAAISVTETHSLHVAGDGLVLGTQETPLLRVPLPAGASDVRFGSEAPGLEFAPLPGGDVAVLGSASPGDVQVQIAYRVPAGESARFERSFATRIPLLSVYVADTGRLAPQAERLHRAKPVRTEDLSYLAFEAFDLDPGEKVALELGTLPPRRGLSPRVAQGAGVVGAIALVAFLLGPLLRDGASAAASPEREPQRNEREAIYDAIRDLDHDFEMGKVSAGDHARLRDALRARAVLLLREEEGGGATQTAGAAQAASAAEATRCARCGAAAGSAHRFCAQCGAPLAANGGSSA